MQELPAIGTTELQGRSVAVAKVLAMGFCAPWVNLVTGERKAWLSPLPPAVATAVVPVSCRWFNAHLGQVARDVRLGVCYEVSTARDGQVRFYASDSPPAGLERSGLPYRTVAHRGRVSRLLTWAFPDEMAERAEVMAEVETA